MLEWVKVASEIGAVGVLALVVYLFVNGKILSEHSVKKLMDAQNNHMSDLKAEVINMRTAINSRLDEMVTILGQIRENGAMSGKKKK